MNPAENVFGSLDLGERSFLIQGTGAEDFRKGYETFSNILWGTKIFSAIFMGYEIILLEKIEEKILNEVTNKY